MASLRWVAAGLAASASVLHWIGGERPSHEVTADAVLVVVSATVLMALAVGLAVAPWRQADRASAISLARAVLVGGAVAAAAIAAGFILPLLLDQPAAGQHAGHGGDGQAVATISVVTGIIEVVLAAVLLLLATRPASLVADT